MLTVAPRGRTKLETLFETPTPFSIRSRVTGSVPELEAVEKTVSSAGLIARITLIALRRVRIQNSSGSVIRKWIPSAAATVPKYPRSW